MGWQAIVAPFVQAGNTIVLNNQGFFVYNGSPALGNLIASIVPATVTDPYGNVSIAGEYTYGPNGAALGIAANGSFPAIIFSPPSVTHQSVNPQISAQAGNAGLANEYEFMVQFSGASGLDSSAIELFSESADGTIAAKIAAIIGGVQLLTLTKTNVTITVPITATSGTAASPTVITTDTPHQATLLNGWTNSGANANGLWYKLLSTGSVELTIDILPPNAVVGNSVCFTLPLGYRPQTPKNLGPIGWNNPQVNNSASLPWVFVASNGNIVITGIEVANIGMFGTYTLPLW